MHTGHCTIRGNDGSYRPLQPDDVTVAKVLQGNYTTGLIGKWGLGDFTSSGYPLSQGYDFFIGQDSQVGCHDWYPSTIQNNSDGAFDLAQNARANLGKACLKEDAKCIWENDLVEDESVKFITAHAHDAKPFFLYLSTTTPHVGNLDGVADMMWPTPWQYTQKFVNESTWPVQQQQFASAVWAQDKIVGAVLDTLESLQIDEQTIVFFSGAIIFALNLHLLIYGYGLTRQFMASLHSVTGRRQRPRQPPIPII